MIKAIVNGDVFDGEKLLVNHAVLIESDLIYSVVPYEQLPADILIDHDLQGGCLVPGFLDLQVNGGGGVLFNDDPTVDGIRVIGQAHRQFGTTGFLPTLISDSREKMRTAMSAVEQAIDKGVPGVLGIHLEGPFLSAERKGAHDAGRFSLIDQEAIDIVTALGNGKTLITIAPEKTTADTIRRFVSAGVTVCAGHSSADYQQVSDALHAGVTGFTHLFNAMTPMQSREPGMVGTALQGKSCWFGIIADGFHVHPAVFNVAIAAKERGGAVLVTDAMPTVGSAKKSFRLNGEIIKSIEGRCTNSAGSLAGSDLDMISAVNNAAQYADIDWFEAVRMASLYPAAAIGFDGTHGRIRPGYTANLVAVSQGRQVQTTWINGDKE